ncbi:MAG TPA: NAD(P)/FAD-dependent oxidoreductase [Pyrinomonadaceae bacterium]|nr:NAD(P)/FAD-dependent oxidoreductase [Pyrinomonadaceae bacterium]
MYDAIVIGARCAGSPTAMLLARRGYKVLLVDRATFPSDHLSTHFIHVAGVERLHRWGLLERIRASNCPPVKRVSLDFGPVRLSGSPPPSEDGVSESFAPRRTVLDKILLDAAREAGAEVREGCAVREIVKENDEVVGIRCGNDDAVERARITIGADGVHSILARAVEPAAYNERPSLTCGYYTYWSDVPLSGAELYIRENLVIIAFPTNDAQSLIVALWPNSEFQKVRADVEGSYMRALDVAPEFAERVRRGRRTERFYGTADVPNFFRKPYGAGWALVGDAGYHKDPITAQGITDSFRDAELLAEAIDEGFSGRRPLEEALADYERRRNETAMPLYEFTCQRATLATPPPEMLQLIAALEGNQEQIDRFIGIDAGTVPVTEFFSLENIGRIMTHTGQNRLR